MIFCFQLLERHGALEPLAIDEKRRRRIHLDDLMGKSLVGGELVEQHLIPHAGLDVRFADPGLLADYPQGNGGLLHQLLLLLEQQLDGSEKFLGIAIGDTAGQHRCRRGLDVEREFPEHKRTFPVSIYFVRSIGKTFSPNAAQCGQLIDEYSVMVTGALSDTERHVRERYRLRHQRGGGLLRHGAGDRLQRNQSEQNGETGARQRGGERARENDQPKARAQIRSLTCRGCWQRSSP